MGSAKARWRIDSVWVSQYDRILPVLIPGAFDVSEILRSGCYILLARGEVVYVGKAKAMLQRVYAHRNLWSAKRRGKPIPSWLTPVKDIYFDEVHVVPVPLDRVDEVERQLIDIYKPRLNKLLKTQEKIEAPIALVISGVALTMNAPQAKLTFARRM